MADTDGFSIGLASLQRDAAAGRALPPVERWNPAHCGDIDIRIARDGTWYHQGAPFSRRELVRLFSTILRKDPDGYVLVTPGEKMRIRVDDVPFLAVELNVEQSPSGQALNFRTNVGDWVACGPDHALRFEPETGTGGLKPYLHVRRDLWARVTRPLFFDLVELGEEREIDGRAMFGVTSLGTFYPMAPAEEVRELA